MDPAATTVLVLVCVIGIPILVFLLILDAKTVEFICASCGNKFCRDDPVDIYIVLRRENYVEFFKRPKILKYLLKHGKIEFYNVILIMEDEKHFKDNHGNSWYISYQKRHKSWWVEKSWLRRANACRYIINNFLSVLAVLVGAFSFLKNAS